RWVVSAAQLDQRDTFSGAVYARGKVVKRGDLRGRVGQVYGCSTGPCKSTPPTKMWLGLGTIIQAKDALNHILQFRRKLDRPGTPAIVAAGVFVLLQFDAERPVHCGYSPGENNGPASRALFFYGEIVLAGKCLDAGDAVGVRTMQLLEISTAENSALLNRFLKFIG